MILISSCDKSNPVNTGNTNEIIPLKVGNAWVNTNSYYGSNGLVYTKSIDSIWVSNDTIIEGQSYFVLCSQIKDSNGTPYPQINTYLARNTSSGYSERYMDVNIETANYHYPNAFRDSTIVSWSQTVTVPAGTFNCIVYKFAAGIFILNNVSSIVYGYVYICPNIGIIKKEFVNTHEGQSGYRFVLSRVFLK